MRATPVTYTEPVRCPECDGPAHLDGGRYGRFYACERYWCGGSIGARLDGTPRPQKGDPETRLVRVVVAKLIGQILDVSDTHDCEPIYRRILSEAGPMTPLKFDRSRRLADLGVRLSVRGLYLKHRPLEDLIRIEAVALRILREYEALRRRDSWAFIAFADDDGKLMRFREDGPSVFTRF